MHTECWLVEASELQVHVCNVWINEVAFQIAKDPSMSCETSESGIA